jgi:hypothetical protein
MRTTRFVSKKYWRGKRQGAEGGKGPEEHGLERCTYLFVVRIYLCIQTVMYLSCEHSACVFGR